MLEKPVVKEIDFSFKCSPFSPIFGQCFVIFLTSFLTEIFRTSLILTSK